MANEVIFNEPRIPKERFPVGSKKPNLTSWVINHSSGLIKNEKRAAYAMLVFALIAFLLSVYFILPPSQQPIGTSELPPGL